MTSVENRARLVLGNWKMNGNLAENAALLTELRAVDAASHCQIGVCVPFPYLAQAASALTGSSVSWGAQDVSAQEKGAYTGEVSGAMLKEFGCRWAWPATPSVACCTARPTRSWRTSRAPRWPPA